MTQVMKVDNAKLVVIIPCQNEADNLKIVVAKLRTLHPTAIIVSIDSSTTDNTRAIAQELGCQVVVAGRSGYDSAVYDATKLARKNYKNCLLFYTDAGDKYEYQQVPQMIAMINDGYDMIMGVRKDTNNTMLWHQKIGTKIILLLINMTMLKNMRDISPFRIVRSTVFDSVKMNPQKYRWPSELLVKSLACGLKVGQIDIVSRPRVGESKVSGSISNSLRAGMEMFTSLQFFNYNQESRYVPENK